jgi:hypothetical protein
MTKENIFFNLAQLIKSSHTTQTNPINNDGRPTERNKPTESNFIGSTEMGFIEK